MSSKFWRQLILAEGVLLIGLALGWVLTPYLGAWTWFPLSVVSLTGIALMGGVLFWDWSKRKKLQVRKNARFGASVELESLRKALKAHGVQPDLVNIPGLRVTMLKIQSPQSLEMEALRVLTVYNEGPDAVHLDLEADSATLKPDQWIRVGPFAQPSRLAITLESTAKIAFIKVHSLLVAHGLD